MLFLFCERGSKARLRGGGIFLVYSYSRQFKITANLENVQGLKFCCKNMKTKVMFSCFFKKLFHVFFGNGNIKEKYYKTCLTQ